MNEEKELISKSKLCQTLNILIKKEVDIHILLISKNYDMYNNLIYNQHCHMLNISGFAYDEFILLKRELQGV